MEQTGRRFGFSPAAADEAAMIAWRLGTTHESNASGKCISGSRPKGRQAVLGYTKNASPQSWRLIGYSASSSIRR